MKAIVVKVAGSSLHTIVQATPPLAKPCSYGR